MTAVTLLLSRGGDVGEKGEVHLMLMENQHIESISESDSDHDDEDDKEADLTTFFFCSFGVEIIHYVFIVGEL